MCLQLVVMKLVVTGMPGVSVCSTSRSAMKQARYSSEEKRRKSSCWAGLTGIGARRGGMTSAQSP